MDLMIAISERKDENKIRPCVGYNRELYHVVVSVEENVKRFTSPTRFVQSLECHIEFRCVRRFGTSAHSLNEGKNLDRIFAIPGSFEFKIQVRRGIFLMAKEGLLC
jgi:hypothetical protein